MCVVCPWDLKAFLDTNEHFSRKCYGFLIEMNYSIKLMWYIKQITEFISLLVCIWQNTICHYPCCCYQDDAGNRFFSWFFLVISIFGGDSRRLVSICRIRCSCFMPINNLVTATLCYDGTRVANRVSNKFLEHIKEHGRITSNVLTLMFRHETWDMSYLFLSIYLTKAFFHTQSDLKY